MKQVELPTNDAERVVLPRDDVIETIRRVMDEAADTARLDQKAGNQLRAPISRLESAERELRVGLEAYRAVKATSSRSSFMFAIRRQVW
jgi:molybdopterin-binding protein